jgi:hypothetical protein
LGSRARKWYKNKIGVVPCLPKHGDFELFGDFGRCEIWAHTHAFFFSFLFLAFFSFFLSFFVFFTVAWW